MVVRHKTGEVPRDAANGGADRGWMPLSGEKARVEAMYRPDVALYALDEAGEVSELNEAFLSGGDAGVLSFQYTSDGLSVFETHQVIGVTSRRIEVSSPEDAFNSCCATLPGNELIAIAVALGCFRLRQGEYSRRRSRMQRL